MIESIERHTPLNCCLTPPDSFMAASAVDTLQTFLDEEAAFASEPDARILVLQPVGPIAGLTPILLDQPRQRIGWDVECEIQLPDAGVHPRHAVILRGQKQVLIKTWDPRTWLNGLPVTESPLTDGDLLRVGPIEFRVRTATTDELLRDMPAAARLPNDDRPCESTGRLGLRRTRLASIRIRLKELRADLARETARVHAERAELETSRRELETRRAELDTERLNQLFRQPVQPAAATPAPPTTTWPASITDVAPAQEQKILDEHAEIADSVADYMEHLLGRMRNKNSGGVLPADPSARRSVRGEGRSATADLPPADSTLNPESPDAMQTPSRRRAHNVAEIRSGVGTLREIANQSARAAVAKHSSQKFRKSMAFTLPLALIAFVLAGVLFLIGGNEARYFSQAFGIVMLGFIALIELANSFCRATNLDPARKPAVSEDNPGEPRTAGNRGKNGVSPASAS